MPGVPGTRRGVASAYTSERLPCTKMACTLPGHSKHESVATGVACISSCMWPEYLGCTVELRSTLPAQLIVCKQLGLCATMLLVLFVSVYSGCLWMFTHSGLAIMMNALPQCKAFPREPWSQAVLG